jgi:hypothetical protein
MDRHVFMAVIIGSVIVAMIRIVVVMFARASGWFLATEQRGNLHRK